MLTQYACLVLLLVTFQVCKPPCPVLPNSKHCSGCIWTPSPNKLTHACQHQEWRQQQQQQQPAAVVATCVGRPQQQRLQQRLHARRCSANLQFCQPMLSA
jgi:hypothetical protein